MSIEVNGIAHIQLSVRDPERCLPFWERFCHFLGMKTLIKNEGIIYCIGGRTGILVRGAPEDKRDARFDQDRSGLHHFCLRARSREDVDAAAEYLRAQPEVAWVREADEGPWAEGYYSILFEDPDGIRVELNYIPGKGHFGDGGRLGPDGEGPKDVLEEP